MYSHCPIAKIFPIAALICFKINSLQTLHQSFFLFRQYPTLKMLEQDQIGKNVKNIEIVG